MNKLKGTIDVRLSLDEVNEINELIDRNTAKAVKLHRYEVKMSDGTEISPTELCPTCGEITGYTKGTFCAMCGQRLDRENIAL